MLNMTQCNAFDNPSNAIELEDGAVLALPEAVDALTAVQVEIAVLEAREAELKAGLIKTGLKEVCGSKTRVVISTSKPGVSVAWKAVAEAMSPPASLVAANSSPKDAVTSVRVYGFN